MSFERSSDARPQVWSRIGRLAGDGTQIVIAAIVMSATLPGRSHGLGLITTPVLQEFELSEDQYAWMNFVITLLTSLLAIPTGWAIDRWGCRPVLAIVALGLGASVWGMARAEDTTSLALCLTFVRGLGQTSLSIVSLAMVGKFFLRGIGSVMGLYAVLLTIGSVAAVIAVQQDVMSSGWRTAWERAGQAILLLLPLSLLVQARKVPLHPKPDEGAASDFTWREAIGTPMFWIFALAATTFNLVWTGMTLFNESVLTSLGFSATAIPHVLPILTGIGLVANMICGALAKRRTIRWLLCISLAALAGCLMGLATLRSDAQLYALASLLGLAGGSISVLFFASFREYFGRRELGRIQGSVQAMTVVASACGPVVFAQGQSLFGGYREVCWGLAVVCVGLASAAGWTSPPPVREVQHEGSDDNTAGDGSR